MSGNDPDPVEPLLIVFLSHAALGFWVSWNLLATTSATFVRLLVGSFAIVPVFGTIPTSIAIIWRGDGIWRVIGPVVLWTLAVAFFIMLPVEGQQSSGAAEAPTKPKPAPKSEPTPRPEPKPARLPRSKPVPQSRSAPRLTPPPAPTSVPPTPTPPAPETPRSRSSPRSEPAAKPATAGPPVSERKPAPRRSSRARGLDGPRGILGEPEDERFEASEVARRVQRSGGSGLGKASTCRSCGTGIDIFSGRCGCT